MSAEDAAPDPIAEPLKPRTWSDIWAMRAEELRGQDVELEEFADDFNLSNKNTLELN
jgi:Fe-S-cluster formation regulator IscX/YfhJ